MAIEYEVDCIILASGYEITSELRKRWGIDSIVGRNGVSLYDHWADGYKTLHGMMTPRLSEPVLHRFHPGWIERDQQRDLRLAGPSYRLHRQPGLEARRHDRGTQPAGPGRLGQDHPREFERKRAAVRSGMHARILQQ